MVSLAIVLWVASPWVDGQETPKSKPQEWQLNGIMAALNDSYPDVKRNAFEKLVEFDAKALAAFPKQSEEIAKKAIDVVNNRQVDSEFRSSAIKALGSLSKANSSLVQFLTPLVNDHHEDSECRSSAIEALGNLGRSDPSVMQSLTTLFNDPQTNSYLYMIAVEALGNLGKTDPSVVQSLTSLVNDRQASSDFRSSAVNGLGILGKVDPSVAPFLASLANNTQEDSTLRSSAVEALGNLGKADPPVVQSLISLVNAPQEDSTLRSSAVEALGNLGKADPSVVSSLISLVNNTQEDSEIRYSAVHALGGLGKVDPSVAPFLASLANGKTGSSLRSSAVEALGNLGKADPSVVSSLTSLVNNTQEDSTLRRSAVDALGNLGKADSSVVQSLATLANAIYEDFELRKSAVDVLGSLGKVDPSVAPFLTSLVNNTQKDSEIRIKAAGVLGNLGKADPSVVQSLTSLVNSTQEDFTLRLEAIEVLSELKPLNLREIFVLIDRTYEVSTWELDYSRFDAYFYSRGSSESKTLLRWIGRPAPTSIPTQLSHDQGKQTLEVFAKAWEPSAHFPTTRNDLAQATGKVAKIVQWQTDDIALLEQHYKNLSNAKFNSADSVKAAIDSLTIWKWLNNAKIVIAIHLIFWFALIFLYPKFRIIQALFFWNPWIRNIAGLGYVSALLVIVPFLQQRLFAPFQKDLRRAAGLDQFDPTAYFEESQVKRSLWVAGKETEEILPLTVAIPNFKGQMILQAPSGFGKTMFLRHLIQQSPQRTVIFLTATECAQAKDRDVIQAIQAKLPIAANDPSFLKSLIYSSAIDICIDGLNEINAEAQASIKQFLSSYTKGNIILTTQPLSGKNPPQSARLYRLQPLDDQQIHRFLSSRQPEDAALQGEAYQQACNAYLSEVLSEDQPAEDLVAIRRVLSNPMDLDTVAEMLAHKEHPELFRLQQQQYERMAAEYADNNNGFPFPLQPLAQLAYDMRLSDQNMLPKDKISQEAIDSLEKHKLLTPKSGSWQFRHDKIWDFFIVQKYLEDPQKAYEELSEPERMHDTRLRGVYLQLATELDMAIAQKLEKDLFDYASSTGDHTTSDPFRKRLDSRSKQSTSTRLG